jgi:hypothetical protein
MFRPTASYNATAFVSLLMLLALATTALGQTGPVLHLSMDDGAPSPVAGDDSGNALDGALTNMDPDTDWVAGISGLGLDFDGTNDFLEMGDDDLLDFGSEDFTIAYWAYKRATTGPDFDNIFAANKWSTGASPGTNEWNLGVGTGSSCGPGDHPLFSIQSGATSYLTCSPDLITLNEWHHIVGVRNGESMRIYVDGVLKDEDSSQPCNTAVNNVGRTLRLAKNQATGHLPNTDAIFDELQIYRFALDDGGAAVGETASAEVATIFNQPSDVIVRPPSTTTTTLVPCPGICGDATLDEAITATDALVALRVAVGQGDCAMCICDVNDSASITATDALSILRFGVGSLCEMNCPTAD